MMEERATTNFMVVMEEGCYFEKNMAWLLLMVVHE
jgi:hypothetical protein